MGHRPPNNDAELLRDLVQRVRVLEQRLTSRAGGWVLRQREDNELVARYGDREVVLSVVSQPDEQGRLAYFSRVHLGDWVFAEDPETGSVTLTRGDQVVVLAEREDT